MVKIRLADLAEGKPMSYKVSVIIPAYNEGNRISHVLNKLIRQNYEVIVIDDDSKDNTVEVSEQIGAIVIRQNKLGYINAIKNGFTHATGDIVVTMDADGEHDPDDIPGIIKPILEDKADIVLGRRNYIPRLSERFINLITAFRIPLHDTGTGFRSLKRDIALKLIIPGKCICGTSVLEYYLLGARVVEVPISIKFINKPRKIAWEHFIQWFYVIKLLLKQI
jgi:glycosyltransferase involved in cell wall biosynthesis